MIDKFRKGRYERLYTQLDGLITNKSPNLIAAMSTISAVMHHKMKHHFWTGFYFVKDEQTMEVGPYQGPVACQILSGKGLCLKSANTKSPLVVKDVTCLNDHIACDARSLSEIVIPIIKKGKVIAVLDIDSDKLGQFDDDDIEPIIKIISLLEPFV